MTQSITAISGDVYTRAPRYHRSKLKVSERALLAAELVSTGKVPIAEAAVLLHVSTGYVCTAVNASDLDRSRIAAGEITLSEIHNRARQQPTEIDHPSEFDRLCAECDRVRAKYERVSDEYKRIDAEYDRVLDLRGAEIERIESEMGPYNVAEPAPALQAAE